MEYTFRKTSVSCCMIAADETIAGLKSERVDIDAIETSSCTGSYDYTVFFLTDISLRPLPFYIYSVQYLFKLY
eukprot:snap_masked-scaffold_13-processed-gene-4.31-mRNA-1 protein AED:1.00 eAED:1.00 QI:0/0/0/0/1/1/2/0/72